MANNPDSSYDFLTRAYGTVKVIALTGMSFAGVMISLVALDVKISNLWWEFKVPLYLLALIGIPLVFAYGLILLAMVIFLRDDISALSFYKSKSKNLEDTLTWLESIAYTDPITGMPNSRALEREIDSEKEEPRARCLILLDLKDFGQVNKRFNHWKGDEYLRNFSQMVTISSRRNEFLYKKRPPTQKREEPKAADGTEDVKAFRKNSGGDEFFILLEGTVLDGLGYLNRLQRRAVEFEDMSLRVLGSKHAFQFHAGLLAVGRNESFESVNMRIADFLRLAQDEGNPLRLYWNENETLGAKPGSIPERIKSEAEKNFRKATDVRSG